MKQKIIAVVFMFFSYGMLAAQTITGNLTQLAGQEIKLEGFNGLAAYSIAKTTTDDKGNFTLPYTNSDIGVGYLTSADNKPLIVILSGEDIALQGEALSNTETIKIIKGQENKWFESYAKEHPKREQALSAWAFLEKIYKSDVLFSVQKAPAQAIQNEKQRINKEDAAFLASLPKSSYVSWFLPARKLVSSVSNVAQHRKGEILATLAAFRNLDYADPRLYKSGLLKDAIESHFWLIENSGKPLDSVYAEMQISVDAMLKNLVKDNKILNEVTNFLFNLLEKHSLFQASEYLAIKVLNESSCTLDSDLAKQLETYRAMKKGNTAPDMVFDKAFFSKPQQAINKLSAIKSPYILVAFGASWCPKCNEEIPEIAAFYDKWKTKGVEVIFISLEEDRKSFTDFTANFPFPSYSDLKKWDSKIVTDYYIFGTPAMFLLNDKREILLRPISVKQADAWVDTF
ncbi:MAG TPA: TlpA disulfide reductase family protein [Flavobacterium sp.]|jgi:thiol-disulfide isomerase/thioredoxin